MTFVWLIAVQAPKICMYEIVVNRSISLHCSLVLIEYALNKSTHWLYVNRYKPKSFQMIHFVRNSIQLYDHRDLCYSFTGYCSMALNDWIKWYFDRRPHTIRRKINRAVVLWKLINFRKTSRLNYLFKEKKLLFIEIWLENLILFQNTWIIAPSVGRIKSKLVNME